VKWRILIKFVQKFQKREKEENFEMDEEYLLISEKFKKSWWNTKEYVFKI
jgi:hypothetical protein